MRYYGATRRELNELAEAHEERNRPLSQAERDEQTATLNRPAGNVAQVLVWLEDMGIRPSQDDWKAARQLPPETSLRDVLKRLGATDEDLVN